jgi:hypothetical protein
MAQVSHLPTRMAEDLRQQGELMKKIGAKEWIEMYEENLVPKKKNKK